MPELPSSARRVLKATYVPLKLPTIGITVGRAIEKYGFVRKLELQPGEVTAVRSALKPPTNSPVAQLLDTLAQFEGTPLPLELPATSVFAATAPSDLLAFGTALNTLRRSQVAQMAPAAPGAAPPAAPGVTLKATDSAAGMALHQLNSGLTAVHGFGQSSTASPLGMLNLERLEMVPAGVQRGELIATIPLAPMEQTAVAQKEWSVTTQEQPFQGARVVGPSAPYRTV